MFKINSLRRLYVFELKTLYSAEHQQLEALERLAAAANDPKLRDAFEEHRTETREQIARLDTIFEALEFSPGGQKDHATEALVRDANELIRNEDIPPVVKDAGLAAAARRAEHHEIAGYRTALHFARLLGYEDAARLLQTTLDEENRADRLLARITRGLIDRRDLRPRE